MTQRLPAGALALLLLVAGCASASDETRQRSATTAWPTAPGGITENPERSTRTTWATDDLANGTEATLGRRAAEASPPSVAESIGSVEFVQEETNPAIDPLRDGQSTFALDVDTGSYTIGKRFVEDGYLPDRASVRTEEYVNALNYHYPQPRTGDDFAIHLMGGVTPFVAEPDTFLFQVGVQAFDVDDEDRPGANLTFVIDVSGSMSNDNKLDIVKEALVELVQNLEPSDQVAIVAYDDRAEVILDSTSVDNSDLIIRAIDRLYPGGSTNAEAGLVAGYRLAEDAYDRNAINRVILASDGVANVGETDPDGILASIAEAAGDGINLVTVGVGMGEYNDYLLEQLADNGDGFYAYVDSFDEIRRLFVTDLTGTLYTVAKDAKVQVEFNPDAVLSYRLLGYENRAIDDEDFRNDAVDAGEIGAGHAATAIYEIVLTEDARPRDELATVALRWLNPNTSRAVEMAERFTVGDLSDDFERAPKAFRAATTVAAYAEVLRESSFARGVDWSLLVEVADDVARDLRDEQFSDFSDLVYNAYRIQG
ncbi:MAG: von Willebrand factor type A domain-containing protein [Acidimicrobiia bacterium]|nr:von Willebrand factor type A domain-containing protein [Acidimicrobiia bacterium]